MSGYPRPFSCAYFGSSMENCGAWIDWSSKWKTGSKDPTWIGISLLQKVEPSPSL